jgi:hypothetical protein
MAKCYHRNHKGNRVSLLWMRSRADMPKIQLPPTLAHNRLQTLMLRHLITYYDSSDLLLLNREKD